MFEFEQEVWLDRDNPVAIREQPIIKGDGSALTWRVRAMRGAEPLDLSGVTAALYCARAVDPDTGEGGGTTRSDAICQAGGVIVAELPQDAANIPGAVGCTLCIVLGGKRLSVARMAVEAIDPIGSDIVDVGKRIPSIDEVIAAIGRCESAAQAAEDAAASATTAAGAANNAAGAANAAAGAAQSAASAANTAANAANAAAARLDGMTATATGLPASSAPTATVTTGEDGARVLAFGIPKGEKGDTGATPQLTVTAKTGEPGTEVSAVQGGTPENLTLELTIPRGNTGDIGSLKINGKAPDASGSVTLKAEDVGALGASEKAEDASKLGGQTPGYYAAAVEVSKLRAMVGPFMFRYEAEDGHLYMDYDNGYEADKWSLSADGHLLYTF